MIAVGSMKWVGDGDLDLMHRARGDDETSIWIPQRVIPPRNGNAMCWPVHVAIHDMVFAAYKHTRGSVITVRGRELAAGDLHEQVGAWVRGFAPFSYDMVETEVQFVVRQHLRASHPIRDARSTRTMRLTFSALLNASPVGSWSDSE